MKPGITCNIETLASDPASWIPSFPNPADFRFNYFKLLQNSPKGLASLPAQAPKRVAVIGAGAAGMTVARELFRCGFQVTIFEASDRIGGRLWTIGNPKGDSQAGMEMGAMRMPFFSEPGSQNCILDYYLNFEAAATNPIQLTPFPNPGKAPGNTGIYINHGYGPRNDYPKPRLIAWPNGGSPDDRTLRELTAKVNSFADNFQIPAKTYYTQPTSDWATCWNAMVKFYDPLTFDDLVLRPALTAAEIKKKIANLATFDGDLGGFGMKAQEADLLYTIGTGDGSWGAFYSIGALWFLRCTFFGFDSNLQTIEGFSNAARLPKYRTPVQTTNGKSLAGPLYEGIQSLVEYLFYVPAPGATKSLFEGSAIFTQDPVTRIEKMPDGSIKVWMKGVGDSFQFDFVVLSSTQWAAQMSIEFKGFKEEVLPQAKLTTQNTQHNISSCKLFFPLKEQYWKIAGNLIPQIIITDTYIQDMYALSWGSKRRDNGVLLASYTWEDDSLKLLPYSTSDLAKLVLAKLAEITTSTVNQDITQYIDRSRPVTIQWIQQPSYIGCAKLYRAENETGNMLDLSYNQNYAVNSNLYFAGENYGVEGGWTEPALRSAMDCVLQLLKNVGATFLTSDFNFGRDYPHWR